MYLSQKNEKEIKICFKDSESYYDSCVSLDLSEFKILEKKKTSQNEKSPYIYKFSFKWRDVKKGEQGCAFKIVNFYKKLSLALLQEKVEISNPLFDDTRGNIIFQCISWEPEYKGCEMVNLFPQKVSINEKNGVKKFYLVSELKQEN